MTSPPHRLSPEDRAWGRLHEPALRGAYEHVTTWRKRSARRRNFVQLVTRRPDGCWIWSGPRMQGKTAEYALWNYRKDGRSHNRSAFVWMMEEWFPETRVSHKYRRTSAFCGQNMCVNPYHRVDMKVSRHVIAESDVMDIYRAKGSVPAVVLANKYGVSSSAVSNIWTGKRWSDVTGKRYEPEKSTPKKSVPDTVVLQIAARKGTGSAHAVSREFNVAPSTVSRIWRGERRANLLPEQRTC